MRPPTPIPEFRIQELHNFRKRKWPGHEFSRFLCVWLRLEKGMSTAEIAKLLGWNVNTVRMTQKDFIDRGTPALLEPKRGGRRRQLMTLEEEKDFLASFLEASSKGFILVINEIKKALEQKLGRAVHKTTVYRILYRHGWRKIVPRKNHPQRDQEAGEDFKKKTSKNG
ncbi:MAG: winged helix-turn-helix domain-containing protein [Desulfarculales bacterium]|jgi:transposase|nr:winged helix-turn-helix domain-containing protein [Desulfarculales bacterium]